MQWSSAGRLASAVIQVTGRPGVWNGLRSGVLSSAVLCRSGVRTKFGVNMVAASEGVVTRLCNEGRTGSGWKHSSQKSPRRSVVGSHL